MTPIETWPLCHITNGITSSTAGIASSVVGVASSTAGIITSSAAGVTSPAKPAMALNSMSEVGIGDRPSIFQVFHPSTTSKPSS
jgi:hypothetical protein